MSTGTKISLTKSEIMDLFNTIDILHQDKNLSLPFRFSYAALKTSILLKPIATAINETSNRILKEYQSELNPLVEEVKKKETELRVIDNPKEKNLKIIELNKEYEPKFQKLSEKYKKDIFDHDVFSKEKDEVEVHTYTVEGNELDKIPNQFRLKLIPMIGD